MEPTTLIIGGLLLWALRGKTGDLDPVTPANARAMAQAVCAALSDTAPAWQTPKAIATAVGKAAYPDVSWPPAPLATASHKAVWRQLLDWAETVKANADAAGRDVCDFLGGVSAVPVPRPLPELVPEAVPATPGVQLVPGQATTPLPSSPIVVQEERDTPTPGFWYRIRSGDTLLGVAGRAYGYPAGTSMRLNRAKLINGAQANAELRFRPPATGNAFELAHFPGGLLRFNPPYQRIYIPPV